MSLLKTIFPLTCRLDDVNRVVASDDKVLDGATELLDLGAEERPDATEDPDVALQLQDGVKQLPALGLKRALLLLERDTKLRYVCGINVAGERMSLQEVSVRLGR